LAKYMGKSILDCLQVLWIIMCIYLFIVYLTKEIIKSVSFPKTNLRNSYPI
jgi:hypothetical protein